MKLLRIILTVFVATVLVAAKDARMRPSRRRWNQGRNRQPAGRPRNRKYPNVTHISSEGLKTAIKRTIQKIKAYQQLQFMLLQVNKF